MSGGESKRVGVYDATTDSIMMNRKEPIKWRGWFCVTGVDQLNEKLIIIIIIIIIIHVSDCTLVNNLLGILISRDHLHADVLLLL